MFSDYLMGKRLSPTFRRPKTEKKSKLMSNVYMDYDMIDNKKRLFILIKYKPSIDIGHDVKQRITPHHHGGAWIPLF